MGARKELHAVDGQMMTVDEIAALLGVPMRTLQIKRSELGRISYQALADMYRANMFPTPADRAPRHRVDGRWMTTAQAASLVGVSPKTIRNWRAEHRHPDGSQGTLQEAVAYYRQYQTGERRRYKGRRPKRHRVRGQLLSVREAAARYRMSEYALRNSMNQYGRTLEQAVEHIEQLRQRQAERAILAILKRGASE